MTTDWADSSIDPVAAALLSRSETGLVACDRHGQLRIANAAAHALLGVEDCAGIRNVAMLAERARALSEAGLALLRNWIQRGAGGTVVLERTDGRFISITACPGPDEHRFLRLTFESRDSVPPLRRDPLTGLADRAWFLERLAGMLTDGQGDVVVVMIDLDRFKSVNDTLGHQVGDGLLKVVAKRLTGCLRDVDLVCRYAGDEFAAALRHASDPAAVGRRIVEALSRPYQIEGATATIGASVGISIGPAHGRRADSLIHAADIALYAAKAGGRGLARVFDANLEELSRRRQALSEALRRAASLGQLELHFQPQMALDSGSLRGFEALVRWNHPHLGQLAPGEFIPVAEETGCIWPIGDWVLRRACEEATRWPAHLTVSVNISTKQLLDRNRLARTIKSVLLRTGLAPHRLELEIAEEALTREAETLPVIEAIRGLGVRVSLDDFGTGCSSLSQLRRFPLDRIKIDRSFINALGTSAEATDLVRAIAALGRSMGITTIAVGVETEEQRRRLERDGCLEVQGFLLSKPVPGPDVPHLIENLATMPVI